MTGSGVVYARDTENRELTFDFAEGLMKDNLLMVDRETKSVWSQLDGKAISGALKDAPLRVVPSQQSTWKFWRDTHPDTRVMVEETEGRPYLYRNWTPGTPSPKERSKTHDTSQLGLGLAVAGEAWFFPFRELDRTPMPLQLEIEAIPVTVRYDKEGLTAWAEDGEGKLLAGVLAYQSGWMEFQPASTIFRAHASQEN